MVGFRDLVKMPHQHVVLILKAVRPWHLWHLQLVRLTCLGDLERGRQVKNGSTALARHHPPSTEAAAIPDTLDLIDNRLAVIAGPQEIGMQRVSGTAVGHCPPRGHQSLPQHKTAIDALAWAIARLPSKQIAFNLLQSKQTNKFI
jgi:hypothetical protein